MTDMNRAIVIAMVLLAAASGQAQSLTRDLLDQSLALGRQHLLNRQLDTGGIGYEYDILQHESPATTHPARQTGALWGLTTIHLDNPTPQTAKAIEKALAFYEFHGVRAGDGRWLPRFAGTDFGQTGVAALLALALVDVVRADDIDDGVKKKAKEMLVATLIQLMNVRRPDNRFHGSYRYGSGQGFGKPTPYADGQTLLVMARAARYAGFEQLKNDILALAASMRKFYIVEALSIDADSATTKAFYQWGSMAFYEIHDAGWDKDNVYAEQTVKLAYWMIDEHKTLERRKNTSYAYEGICTAWELARRLNDQKAMRKFEDTIAIGLHKLTTWQVGSPIANDYLTELKIDDPIATGGVMNSKADPVLRIDVVQHQMHAVIMARRWVYPAAKP